MVEIRVEVPDQSGAHGLVQSLAGLFGRSSVWFDGMHNEVRVRSEWESRSVSSVIATIESWLASHGVGSAQLSFGDESYTIVGPSRMATGGRTK
jgi:hypothetical protein